MKRVVALVIAFASAGLLVASCFVSNKASDFECSTTTDCSDGRICEGGFCILDNRPPDVMPCPAPCTSCDFGAMTCDVDCDSVQACGNITCPAGFACDVDCTAGSACGTVDCSQATSCDITCDGNDACGNVICGTGDCEVSCNANGTNQQGCGAVDCAQACECDVDCNNGEDCASASCPLSSDGNNTPCTDGSSAGCDSTATGCGNCS